MRQRYGMSTERVGLAEFSEAVGSIYDAAFDLSQWPAAMAKIAQILGGHRALMFVPDMAGRAFWVSHDVSPEMMAGYTEHYREVDTWTDRCARYLTATGSTVFGEMVVPEREYSRSEFWNDFSRPADIFRVACVAVEIPEHSPSTGTLLSVYRPRTSEQFKPSARAFLHAIQPHVMRSLKVGRLIAAQSSEGTYLHALLAVVSKPVLAVTHDAQVIYANPAAEALLRQGDGLATVGTRLIAATGPLTGKLTSAIARAAQAGPANGGMGATLRLPAPSRRVELTVEISPLPESNAPVTGIKPARVLLVIHCPRTLNDRGAAQFGKTYQLTPAELKLVRTLLGGGALPEVANRLGIRHSTARAQLKAIFAKTQTHRQTDLLRLVLGFMP